MATATKVPVNGATAASVSKVASIQIEALNEVKIKIPIVGITPLITHRFSQKAIRMIEETQAGKKRAKAPRDPQLEFEGASYWRMEEDESFTYGFPTLGFKKAAVSAGRNFAGVKMTELRQAMFFIHDILDSADGIPLTRIEADEPRMRTDTVRIGAGVADLRYRPEFSPWKATLTILTFPSMISADSVMHLVAAAGKTVGVGEWRPEKSGNTFGCFAIDPERETTVEPNL